jgi:hypothetical protein
VQPGTVRNCEKLGLAAMEVARETEPTSRMSRFDAASDFSFLADPMHF